MSADPNVSDKPDAAGPPAGPNAAGPRGERRLVTVLFGDVVNSTGLAEKLDPEDWTEIMNGAFPLLTAPIERYGGTVGRLMGDGILAFFGAPVAHEDDPKRAVLAGLDMVKAVRAYAEKVKGDHALDFDIRIGINTGHVVIADVGSNTSMERTPMGDAVNIAARMQQTAEPGTVQLSSETYRLVASSIEATSLGEISLKGKSEPVVAYRVVGPRVDPAQVRRAKGVGASLIGRDRELGELKAAVDQVWQRRGQIVCLIGEAGLGKSRLLDELKDYWLSHDDPSRWEEMVGIPYDSGRAFGLFQNYARRWFGVELEDPPEVIDRKVHAKLDPLNQAAPESIGLCSIAMQRVIAAKAVEDTFGFTAQAVRKDISELMEPAFRESCKAGPTVIVIDDLQWADPVSVELIMHLLALVDDVPILFLCAFRPERQSPAWQVKVKAETDFPHRYLEIALKPLTDADTDALISAHLRVEDMPREARELIMRKADGNPYFIEEIVRALVEQGAIVETAEGRHWRAGAQLSDFAIPDSLQALLVSRIDRLDEEARSTLQMASVIGRSFYYRILQAISDSAIALDKDLRSLQRVELLREAGRQPELEYMFRHELARDAAYATILNRKRREFHLRVAKAIETLFVDQLEGQAHRLAQHFELAGDDERAKHYYEMAGDVAQQVNANAEALAHFGRAIAAAKRLGDPEHEIAALAAKREKSDPATV